VRCCGKRGIRIAVTEAPITDELRRWGAARIDDCRQWVISHIDGFERVLGAVAIAGNYHCNRLPHIADPIPRDTPVLDRPFDGCGNWPGPAPGIFTGDDTLDTWHRHCTGGVDRHNIGMTCGERRIAAHRVPAATGRSAAKRPRPVRRAPSSNRASPRPICSSAISVLYSTERVISFGPEPTRLTPRLQAGMSTIPSGRPARSKRRLQTLLRGATGCSMELAKSADVDPKPVVQRPGLQCRIMPQPALRCDEAELAVRVETAVRPARDGARSSRSCWSARRDNFG
jgi:hypothetical protein